MKIVSRKISPRYKRDNIESFLLISSKTPNSKNLCVTLVEMEVDGFQTKSITLWFMTAGMIYLSGYLYKTLHRL